MSSRRNLSLASFDGGGARSFSQLKIMKAIMHRLRWDLYPSDPDKVMLPCKHFDLMGGSDTGGLIAIMFARLRMSVEEAIEEFDTIVDQVYGKNLGPADRTASLRRCMESLVTRKGLPLDAKLRDETQGEGCLGFALAFRCANIGSKVYLRTYPVRREPPSAITIVDAALATCASQPNFLPASFGIGHGREEYVGADLAASNPVHYVISEAQSLFGSNSSVVLLLSLGSGHPGIIVFSPQGGVDAVRVLALKMMVDCELKAQEIQQQIGSLGIYSRFSVEQGMQHDQQTYVEELSWISAQTDSYLSAPDTTERIDRCLHKMRAGAGVVTLNQLSSRLFIAYICRLISFADHEW